jgi:hypothetical protein
MTFCNKTKKEEGEISFYLFEQINEIIYYTVFSGATKGSL